jgi:hypothetical protein
MTPTSDRASEISRGQRFEFGVSWAQFLNVLDDARNLILDISSAGPQPLPHWGAVSSRR